MAGRTPMPAKTDKPGKRGVGRKKQPKTASTANIPSGCGDSVGRPPGSRKWILEGRLVGCFHGLGVGLADNDLSEPLRYGRRTKTPENGFWHGKLKSHGVSGAGCGFHVITNGRRIY